MKLEDFMKAEEFKDFNDYFNCSRNNKYKFSKNKFETTLEYYQHASHRATLTASSLTCPICWNHNLMVWKTGCLKSYLFRKKTIIIS